MQLHVDPKQRYLNLKIDLPPVIKAGSSGTITMKIKFLTGRTGKQLLGRDRSSILFYEPNFKVLFATVSHILSIWTIIRYFWRIKI